MKYLSDIEDKLLSIFEIKTFPQYWSMENGKALQNFINYNSIATIYAGNCNVIAIQDNYDDGNV